MMELVLEEDFTGQELEVIKTCCEFSLDRDYFNPDGERYGILVSVLRKLGSDYVTEEQLD